MDDRTPVLVGVGTVEQSIDEPGGGSEAVELMAAAARAAAGDAGAPALLSRVEAVAVTQGTWSYRDPGRLVAERLGATRARSTFVAVGVPQQTPVSRTIAAIRDGMLDVALVVGGEAKRRSLLASRAGSVASETSQPDAQPDEELVPDGELVAPVEVRAGIWQPVVQYALIENALRAAEGVGMATHLDEVAQLWARFSVVAARNPRAAFPGARDAAALRQPGPNNRLLAFPYNRWHSSQWSVDQAAALLLCSLGAARAAGVPPDRCLFPLVALESSHALSLSRRRELHRWPAMAVLGAAAQSHLGRPLGEVEHVELYSCFPVAVRVQQRELGLPRDATPTVTGGMAFAGGPFNNFTYQATAALAERLRDQPESLGLLTTVSGLLTKPGLAVWSATPPSRPALVADLRHDAAAATATIEVADGHRGRARVASYTVTADSGHPDRVIVLADTPDGRRCVAVADDPGLAAAAMADELVGAAVDVQAGSFTPVSVAIGGEP